MTESAHRPPPASQDQSRCVARAADSTDEPSGPRPETLYPAEATGARGLSSSFERPAPTSTGHGRRRVADCAAPVEPGKGSERRGGIRRTLEAGSPLNGFSKPPADAASLRPLRNRRAPIDDPAPARRPPPRRVSFATLIAFEGRACAASPLSRGMTTLPSREASPHLEP